MSRPRFARLARAGAFVALGTSATACTVVDQGVDAVRNQFATATTTTTTTIASAAPPAVSLNLCPDGTSSVEHMFPGLADSVPTSLAHVLERRLASAAVKTNGSAAGIAPLRVRMNAVAVNSYGPSAPALDLALPGLAPLSPAPPVDGDPDTLHRRTLEVNDRARDLEEARTKAGAAVQAVAATPVRRARSSDPSGCLAKLAELSAGDAPARRIAVYIGDLEQVGSERWPASFEGVELLIVHACPSPPACSARRSWFERSVAPLRPVSIEYRRPEQLREALAAVLEVAP